MTWPKVLGDRYVRARFNGREQLRMKDPVEDRGLRCEACDKPALYRFFRHGVIAGACRAHRSLAVAQMTMIMRYVDQRYAAARAAKGKVPPASDAAPMRKRLVHLK